MRLNQTTARSSSSRLIS